MSAVESQGSNGLQPAVFLDRDGVLNQERGYLHTLEDLELISGAAEAVRRLNERGLFTVLVSNQSGPARGYYPLEHVEALHRRLAMLLKTEADAWLDRVLFAPTLGPDEGGTQAGYSYWSAWRKPNTGMLVAAAWRFDIDLRQSFMVGDKATDVDLARNAGCRGILVETGFGTQVRTGQYQYRVEPDYLASDLSKAVDWILGH
ncbi:D-glycero-alpha-D-manno-heptose-1,7-bisphosphate 7-phosphatase [Gloeobacter kilaueensis]|uniref:D,D-heptose 1,7-bisphosphate phosphatase n=1 Tax=Gloeobacter kilaueensis (strain ATCC BAA-2537 / CCAP 1431/1 / ULC 316 / JS1) TaxID=1183438 RepID=U5QHM1_GLOK1|nr:HAD family hydrolase [Gloeobacter kilaueensis]AGY58467.1 D,D-heptose 1,7-bisphosphate phosphatase [Gloeobacter kilaueensis JS1]